LAARRIARPALAVIVTPASPPVQGRRDVRLAALERRR